MNEHVNDEYVRKAKLYNYRSRASFKLIEITHRYNILKPGYRVIDLGAAPGGWTQVAVEKVNSTENKPLVLSIDRNPMAQVSGALFMQRDIEDPITSIKIKEFFQYENVDVVLSDMAPNFVGDKDVDHMNISVLNGMALKVCFQSLRTGGTLLMKSLNGTAENKFFTLFKNFFRSFQRIKPSASRSRSSELFYLGTGFKLNEDLQKVSSLKKKMEKGLPPEKSDFPNQGLDLEHLKNYFIKVKDKCAELGLEIPPDLQKEMDYFGIEYEPDISIKDRLAGIGKDQLMEEMYKNELKMDFSFTKKVPTTLREIFEGMEKGAETYEKFVGKKKSEEEGDALFEPDNQDMAYEKLDSLADIDDLPEHFDDEVSEREHLRQMRKEQKDILKSMRSDDQDFESKLEEIEKDPKKQLNLNKDEFDEYISHVEREQSLNDLRDDLDEMNEDTQYYEQRSIRENMKIVRQKRQEMKNSRNKKISFDDMWRKY